jgi:hypothetical protein
LHDRKKLNVKDLNLANTFPGPIVVALRIAMNPVIGQILALILPRWRFPNVMRGVDEPSLTLTY